MICTFFGHKDTPDSMRTSLETAVKGLLERCPDMTFYVENNGNFDRMALSVLKDFSEKFPELSYYVILAYLPTNNSAGINDLPTIYPEGIEGVPKRFAISYRNDWIVERIDIVVCYITHNYGGAANFVEKARKKGKNVYNLADQKIAHEM